MDDYNAVLDFKRIMDIKKGWGLELDDERQTKLASFILEKNIQDGQVLDSFQVAEVSSLLFGEKKTNVIITGLFNRGKTFVMNNITGLHFDSGLAVNTRGISMIANCGEKSLVTHIFFDSAGTNVPLNSKMIQCERDEIKNSGKITLPVKENFKLFSDFQQSLNLVNDKIDERAISLATINKKNMETFLLDMVFDVGDVLVVVVNNMTWNDQQFIQAMNEKLKDFNLKAINSGRSTKIDKLFIVHNFKDVIDFSDFEMLKKQYVTSCFTGKSVKHTVTIKDVGTKEIDLFESVFPVRATHFFIGKDPEKNIISAAGDSNKFYFQKLKELIASCNVDSTKELPFLTKMGAKIKNNLRKYFKQVSEIKMQYQDGKLNFFHPDELRLLSENIRVENFSLVSASSGYQPDIDLIATEYAAHILIDCSGMKYVKYSKNLDLQMNEFTVQFAKNKQIIVKGVRSLFLLGVNNGVIDKSEKITYLSESEICTEYDDEWPIRNRKYGFFENVYEANLENYDTRRVLFEEVAPGIVQITVLNNEE